MLKSLVVIKINAPDDVLTIYVVNNCFILRSFYGIHSTLVDLFAFWFLILFPIICGDTDPVPNCFDLSSFKLLEP